MCSIMVKPCCDFWPWLLPTFPAADPYCSYHKAMCIVVIDYYMYFHLTESSLLISILQLIKRAIDKFSTF